MTDTPEKPSLWQRFKTGTKNFFSHAVGYIPRGILLTSVVFGVSAVVESATGYGLGVLEWAKEDGVLLNKFLGHLAIGSVASGIIGATTAPCPACTQTGANPQPTGSPILRESEVALGQKITQGITEHGTDLLNETVTASTGLPPHLVHAASNMLSQGRKP